MGGGGGGEGRGHDRFAGISGQDERIPCPRPGEPLSPFAFLPNSPLISYPPLFFSSLPPPFSRVEGPSSSFRLLRLWGRVTREGRPWQLINGDGGTSREAPVFPGGHQVISFSLSLSSPLLSSFFSLSKSRKSSYFTRAMPIFYPKPQVKRRVTQEWTIYKSANNETTHLFSYKKRQTIKVVFIC